MATLKLATSIKAWLCQNHSNIMWQLVLNMTCDKFI